MSHRQDKLGKRQRQEQLWQRRWWEKTRWNPSPRMKAKEGGERAKAWLAEPRQRVNETEPMVVETQAELKSWLDRVTLTVLEARAELQQKVASKSC